LILQRFKGSVRVLERRRLDKPNSSGKSSLLVYVAEFFGPDAQSRAEMFVERMKALAGKPGLSSEEGHGSSTPE
jgi:hypothetical protein